MSTAQDSTRGAQADRLALRFPGAAAPVVLDHAAELLDGLRMALNGWEPSVAFAGSTDFSDPLSLAQPDARGRYVVSSRALEAPLENLPFASAVSALIADISQSFYEDSPGAFALHCAAFMIRGRLTAMVGPSRTGKSTFIARLSAEPDLQIICDDVLPILPDGMARTLGTAPRLRLPLPENASPLFRAHVERHCALRDASYGYVCAPTVAPFGMRAPLATLVALERREGAQATLRHMAPGEAMSHLMAQNMVDPDADEHDLMSRLLDLAGSALCLKLTYSDLEAATAMLRLALDVEDPLAPGSPILPAEAEPELEAPAPFLDLSGLSDETPWLRAPEARIRVMRGELFLWRGVDEPLRRLNPVAGAIWRLLEEPRSAADVAAILSEAFPEEAPEHILNDVRGLIIDLFAQNLARPHIPTEAAEDRGADGAAQPRRQELLV